MSYRLFGALGYAIGGFIVGISGDFTVYSFILLGMLGGAFLTIPARNLKRTLFAAILGGIGFAVPIIIAMNFYNFRISYIIIVVFVLFAGTWVGFAFRNLKDFIPFGTIGYAISIAVAFALIEIFRPIFPTYFPAIALMIACAISGAFLGHAAWLSQKKEQNPVMKEVNI